MKTIVLSIAMIISMACTMQASEIVLDTIPVTRHGITPPRNLWNYDQVATGKFGQVMGIKRYGSGTGCDTCVGYLPMYVLNDSTAFLGSEKIATAADLVGFGTVSSVALSMPTGFSVSGSPISTSGTLGVTTSLSGPIRGTGSGFTTGSLALGSEVSGTLPIANGGTGLSSLGTAGQMLRVNAGASALEYFTPAYLTTVSTAARLTGNGTAGSPLDIAQNGATTNQVMTWNGSAWAPATPSAGLSGGVANRLFVWSGASTHTNFANLTYSSNKLVADSTVQSTTLALGGGAQDVKTIYNPLGGTFFAASPGTGAIKIKIPFFSASYNLKLTVELFSVNGKSCQIIIDADRFGLSYWGTPTVVILGDNTTSDLKVRVGNDGTNSCIWIGETTDTWPYLAATITRAQISFTGLDTDWHTFQSGWGISIAGSVGTVSYTVTDNLPAASQSKTNYWSKTSTAVWYTAGNVLAGTSTDNAVDKLQVSGTSLFSGAAKFSDGSAAASGITFSNDLNTGLYRPTSDVVGIAAGGVEYARISSAGLTVGTSGAVQGNVNIAGSTSGSVTLKTAAAAGTWSMTLPTSAGTSGYVLQTDGLGVTSWVAQSSGVSGTGTAGRVAYWTGSSAISSAASFLFDGTNLTVTNPLYASSSGTASAPSYSFSGDPNTGMYRPSADVMAWANNGSETMRLTASSLSVGTTSTTYTVNAQGTFNAFYGVNSTNGVGNAGYVYENSGDAADSWMTYRDGTGIFVLAHSTAQPFSSETRVLEAVAERLNIKTNVMNLDNISATTASGLTAANGDIIYVNSTNGTFTSVGFWGRENGVWVKL